MSNITRRKFLVGTTKGIGLVAGFSIVPNITSAKEAINNKKWDHQQFLTMDTDGIDFNSVKHCSSCDGW